MSLSLQANGRMIDATLTPAQLEQERKDEDNTFIVEQAIREQDTGYQHLGELTPSRQTDGSLAVTVTEDHLKSNLKAARERRASNSPVIPIWYMEDEIGETHWFLNHDDALMGQSGYLCFNVEHGTGCLAWQVDGSKEHCNPIKGPSCGRRKHVL